MAQRENSGARARVSSILLLMLLIAAMTACSSTPSTTVPPPTRALGKYEPANGTVYLGVSTDVSRLESFERTANITQPAIFNQWTSPDGYFEWIIESLSGRPGITPMVSWNLPMTGNQITNGSKDQYIRAQAAAVLKYHRPIFIRPDWEMNQAIYPEWSLPAVSPQQYVAAWRHVVNIFTKMGATNAAFVWAPNTFVGSTGTPAASWYPGDAYVDWIGLDAYPQFAPPQMLLNAPDGMNAQASFAQSRGKPMMLAEWAVTNSPTPGSANDPDAMNLVFNWAQAWPQTVKALVYFDFLTQGQDFTLAGHPDAATVYVQRTSNRSVFLTSLAS